MSVFFFGSLQSDQQILVFRHHGGLQLTMPVLVDGQKLQTTQYPTLFCTLLQSVLQNFHISCRILAKKQFCSWLTNSSIIFTTRNHSRVICRVARRSPSSGVGTSIEGLQCTITFSTSMHIFKSTPEADTLFYDTENHYQNVFNLPIRDLWRAHHIMSRVIQCCMSFVYHPWKPHWLSQAIWLLCQQFQPLKQICTYHAGPSFQVWGILSHAISPSHTFHPNPDGSCQCWQCWTPGSWYFSTGRAVVQPPWSVWSLGNWAHGWGAASDDYSILMTVWCCWLG